VKRSGAADDQLRAFVEEFSPTLRRAAYLLLRNPDQVDDAVQLTLLRVLRRWDRARAAPEAYSQTVLVNVCRDYWRRSRRRGEETADLGQAEERLAATPPTDAFEHRETLEAALRSLPQSQREVLVLRFFLDLSVKQTADVLGMAEGTVKSSTNRGLTQLRGLLAPNKEEVHVVDR